MSFSFDSHMAAQSIKRTSPKDRSSFDSNPPRGQEEQARPRFSNVTDEDETPVTSTPSDNQRIMIKTFANV